MDETIVQTIKDIVKRINNLWDKSLQNYDKQIFEIIYQLYCREYDRDIEVARIYNTFIEKIKHFKEDIETSNKKLLEKDKVIISLKKELEDEKTNKIEIELQKKKELEDTVREFELREKIKGNENKKEMDKMVQELLIYENKIKKLEEQCQNMTKIHENDLENIEKNKNELETMIVECESLKKNISELTISYNKEKDLNKNNLSTIERLKEENRTFREESCSNKDNFQKIKEQFLDKLNVQKSEKDQIIFEKNKLLVVIAGKEERINQLLINIQDLNSSLSALSGKIEEMRVKQEFREKEQKDNFDKQLQITISKYENMIKNLRESSENIINDKNKVHLQIITDTDIKVKTLEKEFVQKIKEKDEYICKLQQDYEQRITALTEKLRTKLDETLDQKNIYKLELEDNKRIVISLNNRIKELEKILEDKNKDILLKDNIIKVKEKEGITFQDTINKLTVNINKITAEFKSKEAENIELKKDRNNSITELSGLNKTLSETIICSRKEKEELERNMNDIIREKDRLLKEKIFYLNESEKSKQDLLTQLEQLKTIIAHNSKN